MMPQESTTSLQFWARCEWVGRCTCICLIELLTAQQHMLARLEVISYVEVHLISCHMHTVKQMPA